MNPTSNNPEDIIALSLVPGAGRKAIHGGLRLAAQRGCAMADFFGRPLEELLQLTAAGEAALARGLSACGEAERERAAWLLNLSKTFGIQHVVCGTPAYPPFLGESLGYQAPPVLFYLGNESLMDVRGAGIVGTRRPSLEGRDWARQAARTFAEDGITVASGGATGIDLEAHCAALQADGNTVVVLPEGLHGYDAPPAIRTGLENGQVLLLSEFLPTDDWQTHRAMTRNRTIAAFSSVVCVIEPKLKGGSMFTAEQALAQGRPVFYWGGACRDGALRSHRNTSPLVTRHGRLESPRLLDAWQCRGAEPPRQSNLFD